MKVEYSSNNSGGYWWLKDKDWKALEAAGWHIDWGTKYFCNSKWDKAPPGKKNCKKGNKCKGHRKAENAKEAGGYRWLGCLATTATKNFRTIKECLEEFENITGQDVSNEGCNCCGAPHTFSWRNGYCSGKDCLYHLYENVPDNLRDAAKKLSRK